jgi:hypothetical protein
MSLPLCDQRLDPEGKVTVFPFGVIVKSLTLIDKV